MRLRRMSRVVRLRGAVIGWFRRSCERQGKSSRKQLFKFVAGSRRVRAKMPHASGEDGEAAFHSLVFIAILTGNIILGHLVRANFAFVGVAGVLHTLHDLGFEGVSFLEQFVDALGIRSFAARQSLQISGLPAIAR